MPFQKGVSGNPGGRPRRKLITEAITKELRAKGPGSLTHAQEIAWKLVQLSIAGDVPAARTVLEYTEGKPVQPVQLVRDEAARIAAAYGLDTDALLREAEQIAAGMD